MLFHTNVLEVPVFLNTLTVTGGSGTLVGLVLAFEINSVLFYILVGLVHPATVTNEVLCVAVHQLLD